MLSRRNNSTRRLKSQKFLCCTLIVSCFIANITGEIIHLYGIYDTISNSRLNLCSRTISYLYLFIYDIFLFQNSEQL